MSLLVKICDDLIYIQNDTSPTIQELISVGDLPQSYINNNTIVSPYGTTIVLGDTSYGYGFSVNNLSNASCQAIVSSWNDIARLVINGNQGNTANALLKNCKNDTTIIYIVTMKSNQTNNTTPTNSDSDNSAPLTDDENDLAKLMKQQMATAANARALYASASAQATADQAEAQAAASAGDYDKMNQAYNNMNQALNDVNKALDLGNLINAKEQQIYANNGQNQTQTNQAISTASKSVNYTDPTTSGIEN